VQDGVSLGRALFLPNMSLEALTWALHQNVGDPISKLLLIGLANHCDREGICFPSRKLLAQYAECSIDSVDRKLAKLCESEVLVKETCFRPNGEQTSNTYRLVGVAAPSSPPGAAPSGPPSRTAVRPPGPQGSAAPITLNPQGNPQSNHTGADAPEVEFGDADGNPPQPPFDVFWSLYPRKTAKKVALDSWTRQKLDTKGDLVIAALTDQRRAGMFNLEDPTKIPHPATWLNQARWEDEIIKATHENNKRTAPTNPRNATHMRTGIYKGVEDSNV
jgi:hypothetical protein